MAALVLLHGYPFDHSMWDRLRPHLDPSLIVLAPDLPGFGGSPLSPRPPTLEAMAESVLDLLDREGQATALLAGFSMGGYVALAFAQHHADRLAGVALVNSQAAADSDAMRKVRRAMIERVRSEGARVAAEAALPKMFATPDMASSDLAEYPLRGADTAGPDGIAWALEALASRPDRLDVWESLTVPKLVVHSTRDQFVPVEQARALAQRLPSAHYVEIAEAGHCSPLEAPKQVAAALENFVRECQTP